MKRKLTGSATATLAVFIASGMLASALGVRQVNRITTEPTWVAATDLAAGQIIRSSMLSKARVSKTRSGIGNSSELLGKKLQQPKRAGDPFKPQELAAPKRQWLSQHVPQGKVLYTLPKLSGGIPWSQLRRGDRLDVLARGRTGVRIVASGVNLIGALHAGTAAGPTSRAGGALSATSPRQNGPGKSASSLVVAVNPSDVYPLASISDLESVSLVLHGESDVRQGNALSIRPQPTHRKIELVNGLARSTVLVER